MLRIKEIRKEKGITLAQIAEELNTTSATISRYESGTRKISIAAACKIANMLGVTIDELAGNNEKGNGAA